MARDQILLLLRERIVGFAASRYRRDLAEDVAQEVIMTLVEKYPHVIEATDLVPLALEIARRKLMGMLAKSYRRGENRQVPADDQPLADPHPDPAALAERREQIQRLRKAMALLGERCRELIRYKLEGRSFSEIQAILHVESINTIYTWDHRCRKQLLEFMGGGWEGKT
ncbi:MAG: sigma-70 family RNA polymerase sigma factor [Acidobacteria bacterium]|nr:sigma-70 family RNA polymerase sigma factor [Acidobacteriota bacterium]